MQKNQEKYDWEEQTGTSTVFTGEAEEDIEEDSKLKGPSTRWSPTVLAREFYQLT